MVGTEVSRRVNRTSGACSRSMVLGWETGANEPSLMYALAIEAVTGGKVRTKDLVRTK